MPLFLLFLFAAPPTASGEPAVIPVASPGSRAFLVRGSEGYVLVDTGMDRDGAPVRKALADRGATVKDLRLIVLTHGHVDHYGGAASLRTDSGAPVLAHRTEAPFIRAGGTSPTVAQSWVGHLLNALTGGMKNTPCPVDLEAEGEVDLAPYGVEGRVVSTPGHSAGSVSVVLGSGEALVGDLVRGKPGALDLGFYYEDRKAVFASLARLEALGARTLSLAHGTEIGREEWAAWARNEGAKP